MKQNLHGCSVRWSLQSPVSQIDSIPQQKGGTAGAQSYLLFLSPINTIDRYPPYLGSWHSVFLCFYPGTRKIPRFFANYPAFHFFPKLLHARQRQQVYKARLRVNGNLVAIKVQRPNCESTISLDLYVLRFYAGFLTKALKLLRREVDLTNIIDDFGELIYREIDYRAEMVNCQRFAELYANIPDVFVPKVKRKEARTRKSHYDTVRQFVLFVC